MQFCNVTLKLNSDNNFQLAKDGVTVAEIVVLRALHGEEAVVDIQPTRVLKGYSGVSEKQRLLTIYGADKDANAKLVESLFPGAVPRMPTSLQDIGLALDSDYMATARQRQRGAAPITVSDLNGDEVDADGDEDGDENLGDGGDGMDEPLPVPETPKRGRGRPPGSKNKVAAEDEPAEIVAG
jgi:hypothetical protein